MNSPNRPLIPPPRSTSKPGDLGLVNRAVVNRWDAPKHIRDQICDQLDPVMKTAGVGGTVVFNNVTIPTFTTGSDRFFIMREATFGKVLSDFSDPFELRPAASTPARHARLGRGLGIGL